MRLAPGGMLAITSDLHAGDGSPRDDFRHVAAKFLADLCRLKPDVQVVIAGDFLDRLRYDVVKTMEQPIMERIVAELARRGAVIVRGNHDPGVLQLRSLLPASLIVCERLVCGPLFVCHGQDFDLVNGRWHDIGDALTEIAAALGCLSPRLEDWLADVSGRVTLRGRHSRADDFARAALDFVRYADGLDTIVCGHTHERAYVVEGRKRYINVGTYAEHGFSLLMAH